MELVGEVTAEQSSGPVAHAGFGMAEGPALALAGRPAGTPPPISAFATGLAQRGVAPFKRCGFGNGGSEQWCAGNSRDLSPESLTPAFVTDRIGHNNRSLSALSRRRQ